MIRLQIFCLAVSCIGAAVMGCHLFLSSGVSHPTAALTVSAAATLIGLIGNAVGALVRCRQTARNQRMLSE